MALKSISFHQILCCSQGEFGKVTFPACHCAFPPRKKFSVWLVPLRNFLLEGGEEEPEASVPTWHTFTSAVDFLPPSLAPSLKGFARTTGWLFSGMLLQCLSFQVLVSYVLLSLAWPSQPGVPQHWQMLCMFGEVEGGSLDDPEFSA